MHPRRPRFIVNSAAAAEFLGMLGTTVAVRGLASVSGLKAVVRMKLVQSDKQGSNFGLK